MKALSYLVSMLCFGIGVYLIYLGYPLHFIGLVFCTFGVGFLVD